MADGGADLSANFQEMRSFHFAGSTFPNEVNKKQLTQKTLCSGVYV